MTNNPLRPMSTASDMHAQDRRRLDELFDRLEKLEMRSSTTRVWDTIFKAGMPVALLVCSAIGAAVVQHGERLASIESKIADGIPPAWLRDAVAEMKASLHKLDERMRMLEQRK